MQTLPLPPRGQITYKKITKAKNKIEDDVKMIINHKKFNFWQGKQRICK